MWASENPDLCHACGYLGMCNYACVHVCSFAFMWKICTQIYVYLCVHVCYIYVHTCSYICVDMHKKVILCLHLHVPLCSCLCIYTSFVALFNFTCFWVHECGVYMSVYSCLHIYVVLCAHVYMCLCVHLSALVIFEPDLCMCACLCTWVVLCTCEYFCVHAWFSYVFMWACLHVCMHVLCAHINVNMCAHMCLPVYVGVQITCVCIWTVWLASFFLTFDWSWYRYTYWAGLSVNALERYRWKTVTR